MHLNCDCYKLGKSLDSSPNSPFPQFPISLQYQIKCLTAYPNFIQHDPRTNYSENQENYILLLQIDTCFTNDEDDFFICWEDGGVGNFFIKKSALEKLDFSEVLYHWDCG